MDRRSCGSIAELISAYADNEVTAEESRLVDDHLHCCASCSAKLAYYRDLQAGLQQYLTAVPVPPLQQTQPAGKNGKRSEAMATGRTRQTAHLVVRRFAVAAFAAVAILVLLFVAATYFGGPTSVAQAKEILDKAAQVAGNPGALGIRTVELTRTSWMKRLDDRFGPAGSVVKNDLHLWWEAPNHWLMESRQTAPPGEAMAAPDVTASDGQTVWVVTEDGKQVTINEWDPQVDILRAFSAMGGTKSPSAGGGPTDLATLLKDARDCYDPKVLREEVVAGRPAYVIDLGPSKCPSASVRGMNGRRMIWVDKETFFELKSEQYAEEPNGGLIAVEETTRITYNAKLDSGLFTYTPAAGAAIEDHRPTAGPTEGDVLNNLEQIAAKVDFPLFVPKSLAPGTVPLRSGLSPENVVEIEYGRALPEDTAGSAGVVGRILVTQQRATYDLVARWTEGAESVAIPRAKGWLRRGVRNADGTATDSAALVLRDGTLISISSMEIFPEKLLQMALSLEPVEGSKAPLPAFEPPTLAEVRQKVRFPVFVPAHVPEGLAPEPPLGGEGPGVPVEIDYHEASGAVALRVVSGPAGQHSRMNGESVVLPNGITARYLENGLGPYGSSLWWEQDGAYIDISGPGLTKEVLVQTAASVSATGDLGETETPKARPTPTPVPAPNFTIKRPAWLPEPMTVREQYQAGPAEFGSSVVLGFDPRPDDAQPHGVLTLMEVPKAQVGEPGQPDPQETHETIGDRQVTIINRGENCITLTWEEDGVVFTLTNAYDPPGHPRYTCEELRKMIESIR